MASRPEYESTNVPKTKLKKKFHRLVTSKEFEVAILSCIVLNMCQMALTFENQTPTWTFCLDILRTFFTAAFLVEAILKIIAYGNSYFANKWNQFDFFVVIASVVDFTLEAIVKLGAQSKFLSFGP